MKNVTDIYPLTPVQLGLLFHTVDAPDSGMYVEQYRCTIDGALDIAAFEQAWEAVIARHAVLRTAFLWEGLDEPAQVVRQTCRAPWTHLSWTARTPEACVRDLDAFLAEDRIRGLDPQRAPLMRFALIQCTARSRVFVWTFHHLLLDGWSTALITREVFEHYRAHQDGSPGDTREVRPFREYVGWLQQQDPEPALAYWESALQGVSTPTPLPVASPTGPRTTGHQQDETALSDATTAALTALARRERLLLNTIIQGAWAIVLQRCGAVDDVVFGATVAGRPPTLPGSEHMIGMFINTLPVRARVDDSAPVFEWLRGLQAEQVAAREHGHAALARVQARAGIPGGQPLFETIVVFENYPPAAPLDLGPVGIEIRDVTYHEQSNYPVALLVVPGPALRLIVITDRSRCATGEGGRLLQRLKTVIEGIAAAEARTVGDLPLIDAAERRLVVDTWNGTSAVCPYQQPWPVVFAERRVPFAERPAVTCGARRLTYAELDRAAQAVAAGLRVRGIGPGHCVGLYCDRSADMIIGLIAILETGAAYVPLDPTYPADRLRRMVSAADVACVVTEAHRGADDLGTAVLRIDPSATAVAGPRDGARPALDDLAYVMFTSGSTGHPRGVAVTHRNLMHSTWAREHHYAQPVGVYLLMSSLSFDSSVAGIFWTLLQGGHLCIPETAHLLDMAYLAALIDRERVTHVLTLPALYHHLLESGAALTTLQTVIVAGESCPDSLPALHARRLPHARLYNEYGPTEATVWATVAELGAAPNDVVTIGRPIANTRAVVLDARRRAVGIGMVGELVLAGPGVASHYVNDPAATAERFIPSPFEPGASERWYRTGDLVSWTADGRLQFRGRVDQQVKVRGQRVELGEIEATLAGHPDVREVAVVQHRHGAVSDDQLIEALERQSPAEVDRLLAPVPAAPAPVVPAAAAPPPSSATLRRAHTDTALNIHLELCDPRFIAPPRAAQRSWVVDQALAEFVADLQHLDRATRRFVRGTERPWAPYDLAQAELSDQEIMEDWQVPVMRAMAHAVTRGHGDVLEIGFGRGVSASFIQEGGVRSHTVVESNDHSVHHYFEPWRARHPDRDIRLLHARWQDVTARLGRFDGIFFHAFPLNEQEFMDTVVNTATFAEHFFGTAADHLRPGGVFTYLATEIDSLSRRHQRALLEHFDEIALRVLELDVPADTRDTWWADRMVVVSARRDGGRS